MKTLGINTTQRLPIYLADTLEAPSVGTLPTSGFGLAGVEIQKERQGADRVKTADDVLVIFGNPPYERVLEKQGGQFEPFAAALLEEIGLRTPHTHKKDLKSTKDLFVAFWAWSLWALQPPKKRLATAAAPTIDPMDCHGLIGFVTNRTWIVGRSLIGLRALVREGAKEVWILDLGGDSRGAHGAVSFAGGDGNVFNIRTGVAVSWLVFDRNYTGPTKIMYRRLFGSRSDKLMDLSQPFDASLFEDVTAVAGDSFLPDGWKGSPLGKALLLSDLFAFEPETGIQTARDKSEYSPVGTESMEVLSKVGAQLGGRLGTWARLSTTQRFKSWSTAQSQRSNVTVPDPAKLDPALMRNFVYRPLDFRWVYGDSKWVDWWRPCLQETYSQGDVPSLVTLPGDHGNGPSVMPVEMLMDQHSFKGSDGGKGVFSLWSSEDPLMPLPDKRTVTRGARRCTFTTPVYDWLDALKRSGKVEDAYSYLLAVLSAPGYTRTFWRALESDFLRIPLTTDVAVFDRGVVLGKRLQAAWRLDAPKHPAVAWSGTAKVPKLGKGEFTGGRIVYENGRELSGVSLKCWEFQVSNYSVLRNWLEARKHWTATPSQSKQTMALVSALHEITSMDADLDQLCSDAMASM